MAARLRVSQGDDLSRALIGTGFSYEPETRARQARVLAELLSQVRDIRRGGSAAIDLAWVACGRLDGFYELANPALGPRRRHAAGGGGRWCRDAA